MVGLNADLRRCKVWILRGGIKARSVDFPEDKIKKPPFQRVSNEVQTYNIKLREVEVERRGKRRRGDKAEGQTSALHVVRGNRSLFSSTLKYTIVKMFSSFAVVVAMKISTPQLARRVNECS